jgi:hypothetical protein
VPECPDVATDRERAVGTPSLRVHRTLRNSLSVLVRELLDQLIILQLQRTSWPRRERILVVGNGIARAGGQLIAAAPDTLSVCLLNVGLWCLD